MAKVFVVEDEKGNEVSRTREESFAWKLSNAQRFAARFNRQAASLAELDAKVAKLQERRAPLVAEAKATRDELASVVPAGFTLAEVSGSVLVVPASADDAKSA